MEKLKQGNENQEFWKSEEVSNLKWWSGRPWLNGEFRGHFGGAEKIINLITERFFQSRE